jgi:hypothetical protein
LHSLIEKVLQKELTYQHLCYLDMRRRTIEVWPLAAA